MSLFRNTEYNNEIRRSFIYEPQQCTSPNNLYYYEPVYQPICANPNIPQTYTCYESANQIYCDDVLIGCNNSETKFVVQTLDGSPVITVDTVNQIISTPTILADTVATGRVRVGSTLYILPPIDGTPDEVLTTDGFGNLSWESGGKWIYLANILVPKSTDLNYASATGWMVNQPGDVQTLDSDGVKLYFDYSTASIRGGTNSGAWVTRGINSISLGYNNEASGIQSGVLSGGSNIASGFRSFVGAGSANTIESDCDYSAIVSGESNVISLTSLNCFIGFGVGNMITFTNNDCVILGGIGNQIFNSNDSVVCGGTSNQILSSNTSFIGGGTGNSVYDSINGIIAGGNGNTVSQISGFVGGGSSNTVQTSYSSICGGQSNMTMSGTHMFIGGGTSNNVVGSYSAICGGELNNASNSGTFVGGGKSNIATGAYSFVCGGISNIATGAYSSLGGGRSNICVGSDSVISGGRSNIAFGQYSFIGGGLSNTASSTGSVVCGGISNVATGTYSIASGYKANARQYGEWAHSTGVFASIDPQGVSQVSRYILRTISTDTNPQTAYLDFPDGTRQITVASNTAVVFTIMRVSKRSGASNCNGSLDTVLVVNGTVGTNSLAVTGTASGGAGTTTGAISITFDGTTLTITIASSAAATTVNHTFYVKGVTVTV